MLSDVDEVEQLLDGWKLMLGSNYTAYKNHVYRVINLCAMQCELNEDEMRQVVIAACFHDIAIWLDDTFDYLSPSRKHAISYLEAHGMAAWSGLVGAMIEQHHKITVYTDNPLVEIFRRADWIDVTLGILKFGLSAAAIKELRKTFLNAGFHPFLLRRSARELVTRPWKPLPMMRW